MDELIADLTNYMNESWERGNRVISIDGVRAIIKRHETSVNAPERRFRPQYEHNVVQQQESIREAYRRSGIN